MVGGSDEDTQAVRALIRAHASSITSALLYPLQELPSLHALYSAELQEDHALQDGSDSRGKFGSEQQVARHASVKDGKIEVAGKQMKRIRSIQDLWREAGCNGVVVGETIDQVLTSPPLSYQRLC